MYKKLKFLSHLKNTKKKFSDTFLKSDNSLYLEQIYQKWQQNPNSVTSSFRNYFQNITQGLSSTLSFEDPLSLTFSDFSLPSIQYDKFTLYSQLHRLVDDFKSYGSLVSQIDPLNLTLGKTNFEEVTDFFSLEKSSIPKELFDVEIPFDFPLKDSKTKTPRQLHEKLTNLYCGNISYIFMHLPEKEQIDWIQSKIEQEQKEYTKEQKLDLLDRLLETCLFSKYQEIKFQTLKRFGVEGLDAGISGLSLMIKKAREMKISEIILGMAHRGRLNALSCVFKKPYAELFGEFEQIKKTNIPQEKIFNFQGDVKYHLGTNHHLIFEDGHKMHIQMLSNPSHLEVVNAVVLGNCKGRQRELKDFSGDKILPICIHGDAAFSGQGLNYELQQLENLQGFSIGGTVHIIFNNQIGFTSDQDQSRTDFASTSLAKINRNFVIQVNVEVPELVDKALIFAMEFREKFKRDVFVDIVGYRKMGHNEQDLPDFTQPVMYQKIRKMKPIFETYAEKLVKENIITVEELKEKEEKWMNFFRAEHEKGKKGEFEATNGDFYNDYESINKNNGETGISKEKFFELGKIIHTLPEDIQIHEELKQIYNQRKQKFENQEKIDWSSAESLAFASILDEGFKIRLCGQDFAYGAFGERLMSIQNYETSESFNLLEKILSPENKLNFQMINSPMSQFGLLGFEYGYSLANLQHLTMWEISLSEYLNTAQQIIDQFITTAEKKWLRTSGLIISIPCASHETRATNLSNYLNRILANMSDDYFYYKENWEQIKNLEENENYLVYNVTTPSNYFHALRGQVKKNFRKPLFLYKNEQSIKISQSEPELFFEQNIFQKVIDSQNDKKKVKKVVLCTGKFYFNLKQQREIYKKEKEVSLIRLEQIGPFPYQEIFDVLQNYPKNTEIIFSQEEPLNFGAFQYVEGRLNMILQKLGFNEVKYIGKQISSVTGSSYHQINHKHYKNIFEKIFNQF